MCITYQLKLNDFRQGQLCVRCLRGMERDDMSSILDGDDDDRSAISSIILTPGQQSPREDHVTSKLVKFDVCIMIFSICIFYFYSMLPSLANSVF